MEAFKPIEKYRVVTTKTTIIPGVPNKEEITRGIVPRSRLTEDFLIPEDAALLSKKNTDGVLVLNFRRDLPFFGFEYYHRTVIPIKEKPKDAKTDPNLLKFSLSYYGVSLGL